MPRLTAEELAERRLGMGSTDVVEACGFAPWQGAGPMRLYCEKRGITSADDRLPAFYYTEGLPPHNKPFLVKNEDRG